MHINNFLELLDNGIIPDGPPSDFSSAIPMIAPSSFAGSAIAREWVTNRGMWAMVTTPFARALAEWLHGTQVLEIMAGRGWLAKALSQERIRVIATDNNSWDKRHSKSEPVFDVLPYEASDAIREFGNVCNVLLVSWPPYDALDIVEAIKLWGTGRPIVYIGEGEGGCNAPTKFWQHWQDRKKRIHLWQWPGIYDRVRMGRYVEKPHHVCKNCGGWAENGRLCWSCE